MSKEDRTEDVLACMEGVKPYSKDEHIICIKKRYNAEILDIISDLKTVFPYLSVNEQVIHDFVPQTIEERDGRENYIQFVLMKELRNVVNQIRDAKTK